MSDGGSGGKQSPRGCAEYSIMQADDSLVRASLDFSFCSKILFEKNVKNLKKWVLGGIIKPLFVDSYAKKKRLLQNEVHPKSWT